MHMFGWVVTPLLLLFSLLKSGVSQSCSLVVSPSRLVVKYGDPATANCSSMSEVPGMGWEATVGGMSWTDGSLKFLPWNVDNLTDWEINPVCFVLMDGTDECATTLTLVLYQPPDSVSISYVRHSGTMVAGNQYQLQCEVKNIAPAWSLTVTFYRGSTVLDTQTSSDKSTKTPVSHTFFLEISPSIKDDGAQYWCRAKLELGPKGPQLPPVVDSDRLTSTVYFSPEFSCPSKLQVREGEELNCQVIGKPLPSVTWLRDGQEVTLPTHLSRKHAGTYVINARNQNGVANHTMELEVLFSPEFSCPSKVQVREGEEISCQVIGKPLPSVTWLRDGQEVTPPTHLSRKHAGTYVINAHNQNGVANHTMELEVLFGPEFSCPSKLLVKDNLTCQVNGNPLPLVTWMKNGQVVAQPTLLSKEHAGWYTVTAQGALGNVSHTLEVLTDSGTSCKTVGSILVGVLLFQVIHWL